MEKQLSKRGITSLFFYIILVLISVLFLSLFSYYTSPLSNCDNGYDAAFFRLVGQGMTKGYLPYRDFFDMKGPYLFLIEYIGQLLSYGRLGIFIIQSINLYVSIIIICKIYTLFHIHNHLIQIALLSPLAYVACFTWEGGNLTEELSLIPLFSCLFLCLMYLNSCENNNIWKEKYYLISGFWFGGCFGIIVLIRMTNALLICAMVLTIIISLIEKRKFQELIVCAGMFLTGLLAAVLPVIIYYGIKGLLNELVDAVFVLGFKYSGEKTHLQHVFETIFGEGNQRIWMIIIPCFIPFILNWRSWRERLFILIGAICTFLLSV